MFYYKREWGWFINEVISARKEKKGLHLEYSPSYSWPWSGGYIRWVDNTSNGIIALRVILVRNVSYEPLNYFTELFCKQTRQGVVEPIGIIR